MGKKKKVSGLLILLIVLLISLVAIGCNQAGEKAGGNEGDNGVANDEPIKVIFGSTTGPQAAQSQTYVKWMEKIEEASGGRVQFEEYWSWSLLPSLEEVPKGVAGGVADVHAFYFESSLTPVSDTFNKMPFLGWPGQEECVEIWYQLYDKFPVLSEELSNLGVKLYAMYSATPHQMGFTNGVVRTPADLKGKRIHVFGDDPFADALAMAGATPVQLGAGELYSAFEAGMIDGIRGPSGFTEGFGISDFLKYITIFGDGGYGIGINMLIMNPDFYNSLPEDIREIFDELQPWLEKEQIENSRIEMDQIMERLSSADHTITVLADEEYSEWQKLVEPLNQEWIDELEAKGVPAQEIYDEIMRLIEEYK